jgi:GNAT superfamily N-acetyltransferase
MSNPAIEIAPFDPQTAGEVEFVARNAFRNRFERELWPEDPPRSVEECIRDLRHPSSFEDTFRWVAWRKGRAEIVAGAAVHINRGPDNRHSAWFDLSVLPEWRRQGLGRALLAEVAEVAQREERRLMIAGTDSVVPAGAAFMERLGARPAMGERVSQLVIAAVDHDLLRAWQEQARQRAGDLELGLWEGSYPEEALEQVAGLKMQMNTAPREDLDMEDEVVTPEHLREWDQRNAVRKVERWTMYIRDPASGAFAGYTEIYWNPERPELAHQGDTAVCPEYRNRGLGRWLKAAMLDKVIRDRPQVKRVRTDNANSNAPMLKINVELGFKPYKSWTFWQIETDRVLEYGRQA